MLAGWPAKAMIGALIRLTFSLHFLGCDVLRYLGSGLRRYGRRPILVNQRLAWEFQAVLSGSIRLVLPGREQSPQRRRLWIFSPHHAHGWHGDAAAAEVVVFHFPHVPEPLRLLLRDRDFLEMPLNASQCARLRHLARRAHRYGKSPAAGMLLCYEQILLELSLMALERTAPGPSGRHSSIEKALHWFSQSMESALGLNEAARVAGVSPAHLRRLFQRTFQSSPKHIFDQLRFQRAMQLMADPSTKLESVSQQCGFGSASAFSRAFRNKFGCVPEAWRRCL